MEPYADVGCVLKVNVHCDACKMKMMEILSSICGVYSVTIDAEEGTAKVNGEVDPNILLRALSRSGRHAEVVWVKLKHPLVNRSNTYYDNDSYNYGYSYGYNHGALEDPYMYRRGLPERSCYDHTHQYYPMRRSAASDYPCYGSNYYHGSMPYARHRNYYL